MIEKCSGTLARYLYRQNIISCDDIDYCRYGIEVVIANSLGIIEIAIISIILGRIVEGMIFIGLYSGLRVYTGGYHADTYLKCNMEFMCVFITTIVLNFIIDLSLENILILWALLFVGFYIVIKFAPIRNNNRELTDLENRKYKRISCLVYITLMGIIVCLDIYSNETLIEVSKYIKLVLISIVLLMVLELLIQYKSKRKGENNDETAT